MATSPNYGWLEPDNTDLVKNGALAIRTLGNAIDTTMATMTPKSTFTAKGSIAAATAASTPANLSVGNNGETLIADSSTATGLRWQANFAAGKNFVINGGFDIWQRATSSSTVQTYSTADRWYNGGGGTVTFSQETDIPSGVTIQYSSKWLTGASSSFGQYYYAFEQAIVKPLRNQQVTLSYYIKSAGSQTGNIATAATYSNSTDALGSQTTAITSTGDTVYAASTVTSWTRKAITFTVPSDAVGLRFSIVPGLVQASGVSNFLTGVQLEIGTTATPFARNSSTIQGELAACQRYYQRFTANSSYAYFSAAGVAYSATVTRNPIPLPVTMRIYPTALESSTIAVTDSVTQYTSGTFSLTSDGTSSAPTIGYSHGSGALTQFRPYFIQAAGSTAAYIAFSAELQEMTMDKVTFFTDEVSGDEHAIIDRGNGEFTAMLKSTYDELKANEAKIK